MRYAARRNSELSLLILALILGGGALALVALGLALTKFSRA